MQAVAVLVEEVLVVVLQACVALEAGQSGGGMTAAEGVEVGLQEAGSYQVERGLSEYSVELVEEYHPAMAEKIWRLRQPGYPALSLAYLPLLDLCG